MIVNAGGKRLEVLPLHHVDRAELALWAKIRQVDPLTRIKPVLVGLEPHDQRKVIDKALDAIFAPIAQDSPEFAEAVRTPEGFREILWLGLMRGGGGVTRSECDVIADAMKPGARAVVFGEVMGEPFERGNDG